jgi:hypothetical protein
MRRVLTGLAVAALTVLSLAGPASAASGQVTTFRFHGTFADAFWSSSSATSSGTTFTDTTMSVSKSKQGSALYVDQFTGNLDADGNFTGGTDTLVGVPGAMEPGVTSGFSFTIDVPALASASVSGTGLPATTCTFGADGNQLGCTDTIIDVSASWTGQGPITREVSNFHTKGGPFSMNEHFNGTSRAATATGTVAGVTLTAAESVSGATRLGTADSGIIKRCIGCQP